MEYLMYILLFTCFFGFSWLVYKVIQTEKKRIKYSKSMKVGDKVAYSATEGQLSCEITDIVDDKVTIKMTVSKSRIYPDKV